MTRLACRTAALLAWSAACGASAQAQQAIRIDGHYAGVVVCGARVDRVLLQLQADDRGQLSGTVQRSPWLNAPAREPGGSPIKVVGYYGGPWRLFQLRSAPGAAPRGGEFALVGGLQADGDGLVAVPPGHAVGSGATLCDVVAARRGTDLPADWAALAGEPEPGATGGMASLLLQLPEKLEQGRDLLRRECPAPVMPWLQQLQTLSSTDELRRGNVSLLMLADEAFVPHFGKPFSALSAQERAVFRVQQSGSCAKDPRVRALHPVMPNELLRAFINMRDFPDVAKAAARLPVGELRRWRSGMLAALQAHTGTDGQPLDDLLQKGGLLVKPLWQAEGRAFTQAVSAARAASWVQYLAQEFERVRPEAMSNLLTLERVARGVATMQRRFDVLRPEDVAPLQATITAFVREHVSAAADAWASTATTAAQAELMAEATGGLPGLAALLDEPQREALRQRLARHRVDLVGRIANTERLALQQRVATLPHGTEGLAALVRDEQRLAREQASLLREEPFVALAAQRAAVRQDRLAHAAPELEAMVNRATHGRELARVRNAYLLPQDTASPGGARVLAAIEARSDQVAPFRSLPAGAYFDALYADDVQGLADFDAATAARYRVHWEQTKPLYQMADILVSAGTGQRRVQPAVSKFVERAYERASLITPIMALYLGRYGIERGYQRCIEADADRPRIRYTTVETRKRWGFESSTVTADETVEFVINKRFKAVADELGVGLRQSEGLIGLDRLFFAPDAAPTTDEALRGVRALMSGFGCDDERIRRLETRMVRHFLLR